MTIDAVELAKREHLAEKVGEAVKVPNINLACAALLRSRQLYFLARNELSHHLETYPEVDRSEMESILVQSMASKAEEGFDSEELVKAVGQEVLIFVHKAHLRITRDQALCDSEEGDDSAEQPKGLVLVGREYPKGASHVLCSAHQDELVARVDQIISEAIASNLRVLEFGLISNAPQTADRDTRRRHVVAPMSQWLGAISSRPAAAKLIRHWARQLSGEAADLIVIRDLARIGKSSIVGVDLDWFNANNAHTILLDFARQSGTVLVCAVHTTEDKPESVFPEHPQIFLENCDD